MSHKIAAYFLAFSLGFSPAFALAAEQQSTGPERYFMQSTKGVWKKTLGVRHEFSDGFTADLSAVQLGVAKLAGLKPVAVKRFSILEEVTEAEVEATPVPRATPATQIPWGVALVTGYELDIAAGASISVAVLDTGVDTAHPDLTRRIRACTDFTQGVAVVDGSCADANGHGTLVAGIIAADGGADELGVYGVAPSAAVLAYKVCDDNGSCWADDIAVAVRSAVDAGAHIVNLSLGSEDASSLIDDALAYASAGGVLVVAAAGNDGPYEASVDWPAASPQTVSVSALGADLAVPEWSSRGGNEGTEPLVRDSGDVEFAAPGDNIESTFTDGGYAILSGTSMAAAHVAGLAAALWQAATEQPAEATRAILRQHATDIQPIGDDNGSGWGLPTF
jgi:subtilisin